MKKPISILLLMSLISVTASVSASPEANTEILAVLNTQVAAWNRGDIDGFMDGYVRSDKLEFVSGGKITRGWQTVRDRYHRKYDNAAKMGRLTFSDIQYNSLNAKHVIVLGSWSLRRKNDNPHGTFALIFRLTPAGWRIVHDQTE